MFSQHTIPTQEAECVSNTIQLEIAEPRKNLEIMQTLQPQYLNHSHPITPSLSEAVSRAISEDTKTFTMSLQEFNDEPKIQKEDKDIQEADIDLMDEDAFEVWC